MESASLPLGVQLGGHRTPFPMLPSPALLLLDILVLSEPSHRCPHVCSHLAFISAHGKIEPPARPAAG